MINISKFSALVLIGGLCTSQAALGNGFFGTSDGFTNEGMGGAGVAWAGSDASATNINPGLSPRLRDELAFSVGPLLFDQKLDTARSNINEPFGVPPHRQSLRNKKWFTPIGIGGFNHHLNSNLALNVSWFGGGGLAKYKSSPISPAISTSRRFEDITILMPVTAGLQPTCDQSYGVSVVFGYANLRNNLALPTNPFQVTKGENKRDSAVGIGVRVGGAWDVSKLLSVGLTVGSPVWFTKFHAYSDVLQYRFNLPLRVAGGTAWHISPSTDILVDVAGFFWATEHATGKSATHGGLGWRNTVALMTGIEHRFCNWKIRAGYQYSTIPVRKQQMLPNLLNTANTFIKNFVTAGGSVNVTPALTLDLNAAYGFKSSLRDPGTGSLGAFERNITMKGQKLSVLAGFTWKYGG